MKLEIGELESIIIRPDDPNWNVWAERLADFQSRAQIAHYRQNVAYFETVANAGSPMFVISYLSSGEVVASSLVRRIGTHANCLVRLSVDRGPCLLNVEYLAPHLQALTRGLKKTGFWLRLNPYICGERASRADSILQRSGFARTRGSAGEYEATVLIDLSRSDGEQWDNLRPSVRRQIRRAEKLGIEVLHDVDGNFAEDFFAQCQIAARDKGFGLPGGTDPLRVYRALNIAQPKPILFVSRYEGRNVAGIALMPAGNRVIYEWGFSGLVVTDRELPLSHRLHWEAMRWARKCGFDCYDMGGFWVNRGDQDPINRFKLGFSREIQTVLGEYFFPLSPILGRLIEAAIRVRRWKMPGGVHE